MTHVTVSSKYQVVIPKDVRQQVPLRTGQKLAVVVKEGLIALVPDRPLESFKGYLKGMTIGELRDQRDRY